MSHDVNEYAAQCWCGSELRVMGSQAGEFVHCPNCGAEMAIPPLSVLREQDKEQRSPISTMPSKHRKSLKPKLQTAAVVLGLMIAISGARELGLFDFHWCRSDSVMSIGGFPNDLLGRDAGPIQSAKIYWVEDDTANQVWEQQFSESGGVLEVRIRDYFYASQPSLWLPIYKSGTNRAYFYWESAVDRRGTNYGRAAFSKTSHIFGLCSVRRLREDAAKAIVDRIAEEIRNEVTAANRTTKQ